jgi:hypothetical protein
MSIIYNQRIAHILSYNIFLPYLSGDSSLFPDHYPITYEIQKDSAQKHKIIFTISEAHFNAIQMLDCLFCGKKSANQNINCIDTLYPNLGFTKTNCIPLCKTCLMMRRGMDINEFFYKLLLTQQQNVSIDIFNSIMKSFLSTSQTKINKALFDNNHKNITYEKEFDKLEKKIVTKKKTYISVPCYNKKNTSSKKDCNNLKKVLKNKYIPPHLR